MELYLFSHIFILLTSKKEIVLFTAVFFYFYVYSAMISSDVVFSFCFQKVNLQGGPILYS